MHHFDGARLSPNSVRNAVWHALNEPVCHYLRTRNPHCSTVYIDNSLGPLARDSPCIILYYILYYNLIGPPLYMRSVVDRNVIMRRMTVHKEIVYSTWRPVGSTFWKVTDPGVLGIETS